MNESGEHHELEEKKITFDTVVDAVATISTQVKQKVTKVIERNLGKSYYDYSPDYRSESLLSISSQSHRPQYYGSIPTSSVQQQDINYYPPKPGYSVPMQEQTIPNGYPLAKDNYMKHFTNTVPTITVEQLEISGSENSYDSEKALDFEQDERLNFLGVDNDRNSSPLHKRSCSSSGFNSGLPSPGIDTNSSTDEDENDVFTWTRYLKIFILVVVFLAAGVIITLTSEDIIQFVQISAAKGYPFSFPMKSFIPFSPWYPLLTVSLTGAFATPEFANLTTERMRVSVNFVEADKPSQSISEIWEIPIFPPDTARVVDITLSHTFSLKNLSELFLLNDDDSFSLLFEATSELNFPSLMSLKLLPNYIQNGAMFGGAVMVGLYILIIFELVNRTLSAMLAATVAIGILSSFQERPTTEEMVSWLDMETLILLFSMMVMVSIVCETGFFNYCAFLMYKITNGAIWPMITSLCFFTAIVSAFLDNVTTILLMTPVTIRICEAMHLNPVPVLISLVVFSNIGGAATPVGDPPNVIIANDPDVIKAGIDFASFVTHMIGGIIPVLIVSYIQLRITFRSMSSLQFEVPYEVAELKREIDVWSRALASLSSYSKDEIDVKTILNSKVLHLKRDYKLKRKMGGQTIEGYKATLAELEESCRIKDWPLLIKCGIVLSVVIILFFIHSIPELNLSMGWTALLGTVLLLTVADRKELDGILTRVEWSTLIFFSALFIVMEAVSRLGLLEWIGQQTEMVILRVNPDSRTIVAILLILWVSGLASAFIDNIPFTTMMIKIVTRLSTSLKLPLSPLVWALAFGTCLGGNGTIIGASANVVCAGVADQHGYRFSFLDYFRIGFPMMISSLVVSSIYLCIAYYIGFY